MKTRRSFYVSGLAMAGIFLFGLFSLGVFYAPAAQAGIADHLVINELSSAAVSSYDDWVELYNPTDSAISLPGWSLQKTTSGGTVTRTDLNGAIAAHSYFLIVRNDANTSVDLKDAADFLVSNLSLADNNALYLVHSNATIDPDDLGAVFTDLVGWGGVAYGEGTVIASNIAAGKSLSRVPDGEDTNNNSSDFAVLNTPTPLNSSYADEDDSGLEGTVRVTIDPGVVPAQSITAVGAKFVFRVNASGSAKVEYGLSSSYGSSSPEAVVDVNTDVSIELSGLKCGTEYHYKISSANNGQTDSDSTLDAIFSTLPCGLKVDNLVMTRSAARANNNYSAGWEWRIDITVWNEAETELKLRFGAWNGAVVLPAANNMRYSVDNGVTWVNITANDAYPENGADISSITPINSSRQVSILVQMKVPAGTLAGTYGASYGIMTE